MYDLLGSRLKGDLVEYSYEDAKGNQRTQQRVLGSDDKIWEALRHSHVDVVGSKVSAMLKEFQVLNMSTPCPFAALSLTLSPRYIG